LRQIGIDTYVAQRGRNTVRSLFVVYTFFAALAFMIIVTGGLIKYFIIYCKGCEKPLKFLESRLMFNSIIRFMIETYTYVSLAVLVGLGNIHATTTEQKMTSVFSVAMALYVIFIPNLLYKFVRTFR